jgi:hypothetical protein
MTPTIILAALTSIPIVLLMVLRSNAALVFLSLCVGDILVQFVAPDAHQFMQLFAAHGGGSLNASDSTIRLVLLLLPAALTAIFTIRSIKKGPKLLINFLPAAGTGLLLALLAVPQLTIATSTQITTSSLWLKLTQAQDIIVSASALVAMLTVWSQRTKHPAEEKHGKKHKD